MNEFRIVWQQCPHVQHNKNVMFVEAANAEIARRVAKDQIERKSGIEWFSIHSVELYERPTDGRVLE